MDSSVAMDFINALIDFVRGEMAAPAFFLVHGRRGRIAVE